jgi:hypothetical protein
MHAIRAELVAATPAADTIRRMIADGLANLTFLDPPLVSWCAERGVPLMDLDDHAEMVDERIEQLFQ